MSRLLATGMAVAMIGLFLYLTFRHRPTPELRTVLIEAGSYRLDAITPLMFAAASETIVTQLQPLRQRGESATIEGFIQDNAELAGCLSDPDDTVMVILRGYLMTDRDGMPALACSDLGADADGPTGLVAIETLVRRLSARNGDADPAAPRLIVLDVEPLAWSPRLNQVGDHALTAVADLLAQMNSPGVSNLWVLATRGPLENVGWNPATRMPIATETLLSGLSGRADRDQDGDVFLDELTRYYAASYQSLARNADAATPHVLLMRGGVGVVADPRDAAEVWIAKASPATPAPESTVDEAEVDQPDGDPAEPPESSVAGSHFDFNVRPVVFAQDDSTDDATAGDTDDEAEPNGSEPAPASDPNPPPPETFWDVVDRIEKIPSDDDALSLPHPIAVAPQLWRKWVQSVLHAEIAAFGEENNADRFGDAIRDARRIEEALRRLPSSSGVAGDETVSQILKLHATAVAESRSGVADSQVAAADRLQAAIAIANMRRWRLDRYAAETLLCRDEPIGLESLRSAIDRAVVTLAAQRGSDADVASMEEATAMVTRLVSEVDRMIANRVDQLIKDRDRVTEVGGWRLLRQAYALLRSPLGNGDQRRRVETLIQSLSIDRIGDYQIDAEFDLATADADRQLLDKTQSSFERMRAWDSAVNPAQSVSDPNSGDADFATTFASALRMSPLDVGAESAPRPLRHRVTARPRVPVPTLRIVDQTNREVQTRFDMESTATILSIRIDPDLDDDSRFRLEWIGRTTSGLGEKAALEAKWMDGIAKDELTTDSLWGDETTQTILDIKGGEIGVARLRITARPDDRKSNLETIGIRITPIDQSKSDVRLRSLEKTISIEVGLPREDRLVVAVKTEGLSDVIRSGQDSLPGGAWLRTFVSRPTRFRLSVLNESARRANVRLWLIRLDDPFRDQGVIAYWPETLAGRTSEMRARLVESDGRVRASVLRGRQVVRGPVDMVIPAGDQPSPINWVGQAGESPIPNAPKQESAGVPDPNVTHGFALVARLLEDNGQSARGPDQVIWLVPKPWQPEEYVKIDSVQYRNGAIHVGASLKAEIDGDKQDDVLPGIADTPVQLVWTEGPQWGNFEPSIRRPLDCQTHLLSPGQTPREAIKVPVNTTSVNTIVQLDVDGWGRAIVRSVKHREGEDGSVLERFHDIRVQRVTVDYGDAVPTQSADDLPQEPLQSVGYPPEDRPLVFRGRAKTLRLTIAADVGCDYLRDGTPPVIQISEDGQPKETYWTDRVVKTSAKSIGDDGSLELLTTVEDLTINRDTFANRADDQLNLVVSLKSPTGNATTSAIILTDSTPPSKPRLWQTSDNVERIEIDTPITWQAMFSDQRNGNTEPSGIEFYAQRFGDVAGRPDPERRKPTGQTDPLTFKAELPQNLGEHHIAFQVWDHAGWASPLTNHRWRVYEKTPPPKPKSAAPNNAPMPTPAPKPAVAKRGVIEGKITSGATMRGKLSLDPIPDGKILPADGVIAIGSANPTFKFMNVPPGEYELIFDGTIQGKSKQYTWSGLKVDEVNILPAPK